MINLNNMKTLTLITAMLMFFVTSSYAQVAINKDGSQANSSSIFHVKGDATQKNIIIEPGTDGNVGIGTDNPTATLDVQGSLKVTDGSQGENKILVSDSDGKSSWKKITDVSTGLMSPSFPNGLEGVVPKVVMVNSSTTYTVPNKVTFYILNVYSASSNSLEINGIPFTFGKYNYWDGTNPVAHLSQPLIISTGSVISGSDANDISINGYLVGNGTGGGDPDWTCGDLLVDDRDGRDYQTVQIGDQCWMAQNLDVGTMINGSTNQSNNSTIEKYCYDDSNANCVTYGALYQWDEMMQYSTSAGTQGICPTGWHLPTDDEYKVLEMQLGMSSSEAGNTGWRGTTEGSKLAGNEALWTDGDLDSEANFGISGFEALPAGYRKKDGSLSLLSSYVGFWTSSESGTYAWRRTLYYNNHTGVYRNYPEKTLGLSVRCVQD